MFGLLRHLSVVLILMVLRVKSIPMYYSPQGNQFLTEVQPMYSNSIASNVNQPYNYVLPAQTYQPQIYSQSIYQPIRSHAAQCCIKQYTDPYYYMRPYLSTSDPQFLLNVNQPSSQPILLRVLTPCNSDDKNQQPPDFVGESNKPEAEREQREEPPKTFREEKKVEIRPEMATTKDNGNLLIANNKTNKGINGKIIQNKMLSTTDSSKSESENNETDEQQLTEVLKYIQKNLSKYDKKSQNKVKK